MNPKRGKIWPDRALAPSAVAYLIAFTAGLCAALVVGAAATGGYAIALVRSNRRAVAIVAVGAILMAAGVGAVLGSAAYDRLSTVAVVTVPGTAGNLTSPSPFYFQPATDAWMHFESDNGDYVAGGVLKVWTLKESTFAVGGTNAMIRVSVAGLGDWWYLDFRAPSNAHLGTGLFDHATRAVPFGPGSGAGLDINGDGRGCDMIQGRFAIKTLTWTSAATVAEIDVLFEQHCEGAAPGLRGELWYTTERGVHKSPPSASSTIDF